MTEIAANGRGNLLRILVWGVAGLLLLAPFVAMRLGGGVNWTTYDFVFAGTVLACAAAAFELVVRSRGLSRIAAALAIGTSLFMVWVSAGAGIGTDGNDANLLYLGMIPLGFVGALSARGKAGGMARTALVMALAVVAIGVVGLIVEPRPLVMRSVGEIVALNLFFAGCYVGASILFGKAKAAA